MFLVVATAVAEFRSLLRADVAFLLYAAERVLQGARLYIDVVEINPPLIVALNLPVVALAQALGISPALVYRLAVLLLLGLSLAASAGLIRRILPGQAPLRRALVLLQALVLFPMPGLDFGEREHLMLAMVLPYVWLVAARVAGWKPSSALGAMAGVVAGLGFALKPHFLPVWAVLEGYRRWRTARRLSAPTPESLAVLLVLLVYGVMVLIVTPQYFTMVGLLGGAYTRFLYEPLGRLLLTAPSSAITLLSVLAFVALRRDARHGRLWDLLLAAGLSTFLGGALQLKGLEYHFYPSKAFAILLLGLICLDVPVRLERLSGRAYRLVAAAAVLTTAVLLSARSLRHAVQGGWSGMMDAPLDQVTELVHRHAAGESIFVFSFHIASSFPLMNYAGVKSASRFPQLWILAAEYLDQLQAESPLRFHSPGMMSPAERYMNEAVLADMKREQPGMLLVLRNARDHPGNGYRRLDYLAYFARDPRFARILSQYEFVTNLGEYAIYRRLRPGESRAGPAPAPTPGTLDLRAGEGTGVHLLLGHTRFLLAAGVFLLIVAWLSRRELQSRAGGRVVVIGGEPASDSGRDHSSTKGPA